MSTLLADARKAVRTRPPPLYHPPHHRRPANTRPQRLAAQVRGVLAERLADRLEAGLPDLCRRLRLTAEQGGIVLGWVLAIADPAEYADDPATAALIAALGKPELVPAGGLERCGERQLEAFLSEPDPEPSAVDVAAIRAEAKALIAARTARLAGTGVDLTTAAARLLKDLKRGMTP